MHSTHLEGKTFGLGEEEPDEGSATEGEEAEEDVSARLMLADYHPATSAVSSIPIFEALKHVRCNLTDDEVVHPVGRSAESDTVRALADWPDLSDDDPSARSPGVSEVHDEQPDHGHCCPAGGRVRLPLVLVLGEDDCDDDVAGGHTDGTDNEDGFATKLVNVGHSWEGRDPHDNSDDTGCEKGGGVAAEAEILEYRWRIVQNGVDTLYRC